MALQRAYDIVSFERSQNSIMFRLIGFIRKLLCRYKLRNRQKCPKIWNICARWWGFLESGFLYSLWFIPETLSDRSINTTAWPVARTCHHVLFGDCVPLSPVVLTSCASPVSSWPMASSRDHTETSRVGRHTELCKLNRVKANINGE